MVSEYSYIRVDAIDDQVLDLLKKLEPENPAASILRDHTNGYCSIIKVFLAAKCYGLLVCRAERTHKNELVLVICHAIANNDIGISFSKILGDSLHDFARDMKFDIVRHHADSGGLCRLLDQYYDEVQEIVYIKRLK